jgi:putative oxidoreductase
VVSTLQRLFSGFPGAMPGAGLLLLRVCAGTPLILAGTLGLRALWRSGPFAAQAAAMLVGVFLLVGFWTPFMGAFQALIELWSAFSSSSETTVHLLLAALGISLVMLGPGAWSLDARLFGRKRIDIT